MRSYRNVASIERVLAVLECVNRTRLSKVEEVSASCALPPSTVVRLLETLCERGYLTKNGRLTGYCVTSKVLGLSAGFHGLPALLEAARPHADALTRRLLWPVALATLDANAMVVRYSTIPLSPLAHAHSTLGKRLSLVARAHGRAYLAFCSANERRTLMRLVVASDDPERGAVACPWAWRSQIRRDQARGYAQRSIGIDPQTQSIAVPVRGTQGRVVATLGMTYFSHGLRAGEFSTALAALHAAALGIGLGIGLQVHGLPQTAGH